MQYLRGVAAMTVALCQVFPQLQCMGFVCNKITAFAQAGGHRPRSQVAGATLTGPVICAFVGIPMYQ